MLLSDLSPLALVPCQLPFWSFADSVWSRFGSHTLLPLGFLPTQDDEAHSLMRRGELGAQLEMYGGPGLSGNAGGVRCANFAGYQVKGIGQSVLAGFGTDKWHRHGALSLQDAIREVIMGELIHVASPYGAVRATAIVDLGFSFRTEVGVDKLPSSAPRALLYRELSVRAAHFMRSSFLDTGPEFAVREVDRMRDGIPRFVNWLCRDLGTVSFGSAAQGLLLMFERLMNQVAVLRTKRLVHGSLIASNFCLDGRFLDFTTSTAVSTLQPVMVSLGGVTSQQQHHQILQALPDLLFYVAKFDRRCGVVRAHVEEVAAVLTSELNAMHHRYLVREHLGLFGFPLADALQLPTSIKEELFEALLGAIAVGQTSGHLYFGGDEHPMLAQEGRDDLFALVVSAVSRCCGLQICGTSHYEPRVSDFPGVVIRAFCGAYQRAMEAFAAAQLTDVERGMAWLIRAMQRHADLSSLYRRHLDGEIDRVCKVGEDVGNFVHTTLADWEGVFNTSADGIVPLNGWLTQEPAYLLPDGRLQLGNQVCSPLTLAHLRPAARCLPRHRWLYDVAAMNRDAAIAGVT